MTAKKYEKRTEEREETNGEEVAAGGKQGGEEKKREGRGRIEEKNEVMVLGGEFVSAF